MCTEVNGAVCVPVRVGFFFFNMGYKRVHNKRFVVCSLCLMFFRFLCLWLMLQIYCGLFSVGFGLYLELKSLFLVRVIFESLSREDTCSFLIWILFSSLLFLLCCSTNLWIECWLTHNTQRQTHNLIKCKSDFYTVKLSFFSFFFYFLWYFPDWWTLLWHTNFLFHTPSCKSETWPPLLFKFKRHF